MDEWIRQLVKLTLEMVDDLESATFESMLAFVELREQMIKELDANTLQEIDRAKYQKVVEDLLKRDAAILARMDVLKNQASEGSTKIVNARIQRSAYDAIYTPDSVFFDKKK